MTKKFLYMFEFVVDDLLIVHPNECAPDEYPTCVELTFRSSVYLQICDRNYGDNFTDNIHGNLHTLTRNGKCCLFGLESEVTDKDKLYVHVFKKKIEKCKFLLGKTDISIKSMFDRVTNDFIQKNPILEIKMTNKEIQQEEYCPSSEIEKKLISLYDLDGKQTGNMVIKIRLSCMGPTIVSPFKISKQCNRNESNDHNCNNSISSGSGYLRGGNDIKTNENCAHQAESSNSCSIINETDQSNASVIANVNDKISKKSLENCHHNKKKQYDRFENERNRYDEEKNSFGQNYVEDCVSCVENEKDSLPSTKNTSPTRQTAVKTHCNCNANNYDEYDEFEADMNGNGLLIRVLKNYFQVNIEDSDYESDNDGGDDNFCYQQKQRSCLNDTEFEKSKFLSNQLCSHIGGTFINGPGLPRIHGNIKYAGNEIQMCNCNLHNKNFKLSKPIKNKYDKNINKINKYRKRCPKNRTCCIQVQPDEIDNTLNHINRKIVKDGIEICHKKCHINDEDGDIFLFKLGKQNKCENKKNLIEIELKTPKIPIELQKPLVSQHTQIDEFELDSELKNVCLEKKTKKKVRSKKKN